MAKVVVDTQGVVAPRWWSSAKVLIVGAVAGIAWWAIWTLLKQSIISEPSSAGGVSHIIIAVATVVTLIKFSVSRPLVISLTTVVLLWPLSTAIAGLGWVESLFWSIGLFAASYGLFSLVSRIRTLWIAIITAIIIVAVAMIVLAL